MRAELIEPCVLALRRVRLRDGEVRSGPDLLRIKGLLNLAGSKGPVVFQAVQHLIHPPVELSSWPDKDHGSLLNKKMRDRIAQEMADQYERLQNSANRPSPCR